MKKKNDSILMYKDEQINKNIQNRKNEENKKEQQLAKQQAYEEKLKIKQSRFSLFGIPFNLVLCIGLLIATIGVSVYFRNYLYIVNSVITIFFIGFVGRRINFKYDDVFNVLIWNFILALDDFLSFKIRKDIISKYRNIAQPSLILLILSLLFMKSSFSVFGIIVSVFLVSLIIPFIYKEFPNIVSKLNVISTMALIGFISKTVLYSFLQKDLYIDFTNITICIVVTIISHYISQFKLEEPAE